MALSITVTYADGTTLSAADLNNIVNDVEAWANGTGNISTSHLADLAVTAAKLNTDAVTTAKILDANVTTAKIADGAITLAKMADSSVDTAELVDDAVTAAKLDETGDFEVNSLTLGTSGPTLEQGTSNGILKLTGAVQLWFDGTNGPRLSTSSDTNRLVMANSSGTTIGNLLVSTDTNETYGISIGTATVTSGSAFNVSLGATYASAPKVYIVAANNNAAATVANDTSGGAYVGTVSTTAFNIEAPGITGTPVFNWVAIGVMTS